MPENIAEQKITMDFGTTLLNESKLDENKGIYNLYGIPIPIGPAGAAFLKLLIQPAQIFIADKGAQLARDGTKAAALAITKDAQQAAKIGAVGEWVWRLGFPPLDMIVGMAKAAFNGRRDLHKLTREASTLLAANHGGKVGVGSVLAKVPSALAYERARIFKNAKNGVFTQFTGLFSVVPQWIVGYWRYQQSLMEDARKIYHPKSEDKLITDIEEEKKKLFERIGGAAPEETATMYSEMAAGADGVYDANKDTRKLPFGFGKSPSLNNKIHNFLHPTSYQALTHNTEYNPASMSPAFLLPGIGSVVGDMVKKGLYDRTYREDSAWRHIVKLDEEIKNYAKSHAKQGHSSLPSNTVHRLVTDIFKQHAIDRGISEGNLPDGDEFNTVIRLITKAITEDKLPAVAIAEMLDNKDIVIFDRYDVSFGEEILVDAEISQYLGKYAGKDFYKNVPFTKKDAVEALRNLPAEELQLFVQCFPKGVLEGAVTETIKAEGGSEADIAEAVANIAQHRKNGEDQFKATVVEAVKGVLKADRKELQNYGIPEKVIKKFEILQAQLAHKKDSDLEEHTGEMAALLRDLAMSAMSAKDGSSRLWTEYVGKTDEEETTPSRSDRRRGDDDDERRQPKPFSERTKPREKPAKASARGRNYDDDDDGDDDVPRKGRRDKGEPVGANR